MMETLFSEKPGVVLGLGQGCKSIATPHQASAPALLSGVTSGLCSLHGLLPEAVVPREALSWQYLVPKLEEHAGWLAPV